LIGYQFCNEVARRFTGIATNWTMAAQHLLTYHAYHSSVMNAAARLVFSFQKYDHVTPLLSDLHWLRHLRAPQ